MNFFNEKKNKKGFTSFEVIIGIIITIVSFYLILGFFVSNKDVIGTAAQDLQCRATIEAKAMSSVDATTEVANRAGIDSFLTVLNNKCFVDHITIKESKKELIYKQIADEQARCWYRYGEGEDDFLKSFQTTGNWCFVCGTVEISENNVYYEYKNYIDWLSKTEYKKEEGKSVKYSEYMSVKYTDITPDELAEIKLSLQDILEEKDPAFTEVASMVTGQYEILQDLRLKKISSEEPMYVVYRYNRVEKSFDEKMSSGIEGAMYASVGAIVLGAVVESGVQSAVISGGACAVSVIGTAVTPICAVIGGVAGTIYGSVKGIFKSSVSIAKITKLQKISSKISSFIKDSKKLNSIQAKMSYLTFKGKNILSVSKTKSFDIDVNEMRKLSEEFKQLGKAEDLKKADSLNTLADMMVDMKIEKYSDIEKLQFSKSEDLKKLNKLLDNGVDNHMISDEVLNAYSIKESKLVDQIKDYDDLKLMIKQEIETTGKLSPESELVAKDYLRVAYITSAGLTGVYIGTNINSKSDQYVDIMTKEQYFRLCGTERRVDERLKK